MFLRLKDSRYCFWRLVIAGNGVSAAFRRPCFWWILENLGIHYSPTHATIANFVDPTDY